jgi:hypothetical protein
MLGLTVRIAQRMGLDDEACHKKCTVFEAEMRRRLWWALVHFDNRLSEVSAFQPVLLASPWTCKTPLNVNDYDLSAEMPRAPTQGRLSEALFAVVRSEAADFIRKATFHNVVVAPALREMGAPASEYGEPDALYAAMYSKYLCACRIDNPLQDMATWTVRFMIAKYRFAVNNAQMSKPDTAPTDEQRTVAMRAAIDMLEIDTMLMKSELIAGFRWFTQLSFPMPAYVRLAQELKRKPNCAAAEECWAAMSHNHEVRFAQRQSDGPMFLLLARLILWAWDALEAWREEAGVEATEPPWIVGDIRASQAARAENGDPEDLSDVRLTVPDSVDVGGWSQSRLALVQGWDFGVEEFVDPRLVSRVEWDGMIGYP